MRKSIFLLFSFLLLLFTAASAQNSQSVLTAPKIFRPDGEKFSVAAPGNLEEFDYDEKSKTARYSAEIDGRYFFIAAISPENIGKDGILHEFVREIKVSPTSERGDNFTVEKYSFLHTDGFFHNLWIIKTANRNYYFHAASEIENDRIIAGYFDSIKIDRKPNERKTPPVIKNNMGNNEHSRPESRAINPFSNILASFRPNRSPLADKKKLKILFKPLSAYPDAARYFNIQGTVWLKAEFLAAGNIGDVSVTKRLPFGLTEEAIKTARQTKFEPATDANGAPVTVTKTVAFTFAIY